MLISFGSLCPHAGVATLPKPPHPLRQVVLEERIRMRRGCRKQHPDFLVVFLRGRVHVSAAKCRFPITWWCHCMHASLIICCTPLTSRQRKSTGSATEHSAACEGRHGERKFRLAGVQAQPSRPPSMGCCSWVSFYKRGVRGDAWHGWQPLPPWSPERTWHASACSPPLPSLIGLPRTCVCGMKPNEWPITARREADAQALHLRAMVVGSAV